MKYPWIAGLALLLAACTSTTNSVAEGSEDDFGLGGDRPPTVRTMHTMARVLASQGRDAQCELVLFKLIGDHPDFMPAYVELAELYMRAERPEDAIEVLTVGVDRAPGDLVLVNDLGMAHLIQGDYEAAYQRFVDAALIDPEDARSRANAATALGMLGRYDEALELYLLVLPRTDAHHNLGVLCEGRGDVERAADEFAAAASAASATTTAGDQRP